jgi:hypothetical protein
MGDTKKFMCCKGIYPEQLPASKGIRALMKDMKLCVLVNPEKPGSHLS